MPINVSAPDTMPIWLSVFLAAVFWGTLLVLRFIERKKDRS